MAGRVRGILEKLLGQRREIALSEVVSDAELLRRFTATRDEAAFELLVWRHGAMVLGICRRAMRDEELAEDAFQAVFIVLARKADSIRGGNVGGWLFRVARRVAARAARRHPAMQPIPEVSEAPQPSTMECQELTEILDAEVARLPERLRRPIILCYLGGRTTEDAARELGCPRGTVLSRLAAARKRLAERLTRRGVTAPVLGTAIGHQTSSRLISQTIAASQTPFHLSATTGPTLLAESVVRAMATTRLVVACGAIVLAAGLSLGVGWAAAGTDSDEGGSPLATSAPAAGQPAGGPIRVEQEKDKKPPAQTDALKHQSDAISRRIEELRARITQETPDDELVDVSVLQAELFAVDRQVLQAEKMIRTEERSLEQSIKNKDSVAKMVIDKRDLLAVVDKDPDVRQANMRLSKANQVVVAIKTKITGDEHPAVQAATKEVLDAEAALKGAREQASPMAERQIRDNLVRDYDSHAVRYKERIENDMHSLAELRDTRKKLALRIAEVRQGESRRLSLQDELKVLREIQLELLRLRTISELGIEGLHPVTRRTETDPKVEAQFTEMRREIEALRAEVDKLRKKD